MKTNRFALTCHSIVTVVIFCFVSTLAFSQESKTPVDTLKATSSDTIKAVQAVPVATPTAEQETPKAKKEKKNKIVVYAGANFTDLTSSSTSYESEAQTGYHLGVYYRQGRFAYWQVGARLASSAIGYKPAYSSNSEFTSIKVTDLDFPLTLGLNLTSFMNRALAVRLFASAVPAITLGVNENPVITKDDLNSFIFYGQGGVGFDVAFLVLEAGYNYGFNEIITDYPETKPGQVFINLGFRF